MRLVLIGFWISNRATYKSQYFFYRADGKTSGILITLNDPKPYLLYGKCRGVIELIWYYIKVVQQPKINRS
jgi:hypothetical protein